MPAGLNWAIWFDLSPLRPDEWAKTVASRWLRNFELSNAYHAGVAEAIAERKDAKAAADKIRKMQAAR